MEKRQNALKTRKNNSSPSLQQPEFFQKSYDMIVFSHLRWNFVYQRPQHLISRLSSSLKVLFVEEPVPHEPDDRGKFELDNINSSIDVLKPKAGNISEVIEILKDFLPVRKMQVGWFYSPAFSEVLSEFTFQSVVYDCMDELSLFRGANPELVKQEKFLLSEANIVFTGGKSLYEAKSRFHENVHCFPSSVERQHFSKAQHMSELPEDIKNIMKPVVGYFGVIDERINLQLLEGVATLKPDVNFVMIGPLAKIAEEDLPRKKNIHYLGMKSYKDLPDYLAAFDVAMMPFALNDATRFISPTKTLEYMAAGKPIISTPIKDVERDYSHCIRIIDTAEEFSESIDKILMDGPEGIEEYYRNILDATSWDITAEKMKQLIKSEVSI